jgi:hypothetical protein
VDDAEPGRMRDGISAAYGIKLVEKRADVELGGVNRYAELPGDDLVRGAFGEQRQHFEFTGRQDSFSVSLRRRSRGYHQNLGLLVWSDQPNTRHGHQQRCQSSGEGWIGDIERHPDGLGRNFLAQAAGLSPIVSET